MRFKCGRCEAAVFENETERSGASVKMKRVTFQKRYRSTEGVWKTTYTLDVNEIPKAVLVLTKAYEYLVLADDTTENGPGTA
jgi:hypothetical protein